MTKFAILFLTTALLAATLTAPAVAATRCADFFAAMGRTFVPDAPQQDAGLKARGKILDCPPGQYWQLAYDHLAVRNAQPVASADQLAGTWVSDDVLGMASGVFIPVFEVIVITPGAKQREVEVVQKLVRAYDSANWFRGAGIPGLMPPVDVVAARPLAVYGTHRAALASPGKLEPRRVRYRDFPLEGDRGTSLRMKQRMMSFEQGHPIGVATDGVRLVFRVFDRLAPGGERILTFRKRRAFAPEQAHLLAITGEWPMGLTFHCFLNTIDQPSAAFVRALGNLKPEDFFAALHLLQQIDEQLNAIGRRLSAIATDAAKRDESQALSARQKVLFLARLSLLEEAGPARDAVAVLKRENAATAPFGCKTDRF